METRGFLPATAIYRYIKLNSDEGGKICFVHVQHACKTPTLLQSDQITVFGQQVLKNRTTGQLTAAPSGWRWSSDTGDVGRVQEVDLAADGNVGYGSFVKE